VPFKGGVDQLKSVQESGHIDEYTISLGGNYKERLMLGITIGIPSVNYQRNYYYQETLDPTNVSSNPYGFTTFNYNQSVSITGAGINAKIGAIYKINDMIRIGAAFHSPTYYTISDVSGSGITTIHNDSAATISSDNGDFLPTQFDYNFTTPWKGILSATFLIKKLGFITADYEYVDYSSMHYRYPTGFDAVNGMTYQSEADAMNQTIRKTYQGTSNFRLGAEGRISKVFMVRLGGGYYGNAYSAYGEANELNYTTQRIDLNAGLVFHFKHFFTDLGFVHSMYQGIQKPYAINYPASVSVPQAEVNYSLNNVALTMGVKF
jgi:hypothetical protein